MKRIANIYFFLFFCFLFSVSCCFSQSLTNSPYSRYGLGELQYGGFSNNIPMGGIYTALQNDTTAPFYINTSNPASHSSVKLTVFDFGIKSNFNKLETSSAKFSSNQTALSHLALAFPAAKFWGISLGMIPYSSAGYRIHDEKNQDSIGTVKYSYEGKGGINQLYWGNGFKVKNFSAGVNASYLFGGLEFSSRDSFPDTSYFFNTKLSQTTNVSDLYFTTGAQYKMKLKKDWSLMLGGTFSWTQPVNVKKTTFAATYRNTLGVEVMKDTIINEEDVRGAITIPMTLGGGFVLKKSDKWLFGFDYSMQNWEDFDSFGQKGKLKNSQRFAFGAQYIPNKNAGTKEPYGKKIFYRAGFRFANSYLNLNAVPLNDFAFTFGAGFPLRKMKAGETYSQSIINVGFEIGQMGTTDSNLIRQQYVKAVVGFTLNDRWFIKRKYD